MAANLFPIDCRTALLSSCREKSGVSSDVLCALFEHDVTVDLD